MMVFVTYVTWQQHQRAQLALETGAIVQTEEIQDAGSDRTGVRPAAAEPGSRPAASQDRPTIEAPASTPPVVRREIPLRSVTLDNGQVVARISNGPSLIESWRLRDYTEYTADGEIPIELVEVQHPVIGTEILGVPGERFANLRFEVIQSDARSTTQRAETAAGVFTRTIRLDEKGYGFELELSFENRRTDAVDAKFEILWPAGISDRQDFHEVSLLAYGSEEGVTRELVQGVGQPGFFGIGGSPDGIEIVEGRSRWAGFDIQYFTGVLIDPADTGRLGVRFESLEPKKSAEAKITLPSVSLASGRLMSETLRGFFGPKTPTALAEAGYGLEHSVSRGWSWLEPLVRFFEIALDKLYLIIPNYGWAIIVLTILVRIFTAPLMVRQMRSAERMRTVQPRMKEIQERFKDNRQKQSEETMKLYRDEGINPLAGCLPLVLQFPVLIGLFYALRSSIGLRHAPFGLWINDLSQPETLFTIPGIDFPFRLLPLIMGASMFVQQKMTPTTGMDPTQARMMLIMMPGMMLFVSYTFPSGLVLYWTVSNLLGIAHQYWIRSKTQPQS